MVNEGAERQGSEQWPGQCGEAAHKAGDIDRSQFENRS